MLESGQKRVYRVEHQGVVLGRLMFHENQWLAMRNDTPSDTEQRKVKAFYSREDALVWIKRDNQSRRVASR
jgi:hypothetical protein